MFKTPPRTEHLQHVPAQPPEGAGLTEPRSHLPGPGSPFLLTSAASYAGVTRSRGPAAPLGRAPAVTQGPELPFELSPWQRGQRTPALNAAAAPRTAVRGGPPASPRLTPPPRSRLGNGGEAPPQARPLAHLAAGAGAAHGGGSTLLPRSDGGGDEPRGKASRAAAPPSRLCSPGAGAGGASPPRPAQCAAAARRDRAAPAGGGAGPGRWTLPPVLRYSRGGAGPPASTVLPGSDGRRQRHGRPPARRCCGPAGGLAGEGRAGPLW